MYDTYIAHLTFLDVEVKVKLSLCFNWASPHEGVLVEWKYCYTLSWSL